jgi:hypothetical protein
LLVEKGGQFARARAGPEKEKSRRRARPPTAAHEIADDLQNQSATASLSGRSDRSKSKRALAAFRALVGSNTSATLIYGLLVQSRWPS